MNFAFPQFGQALCLYAGVVVLPYFVFCLFPAKVFLPWQVGKVTANWALHLKESKATLLSFLVLLGVLMGMEGLHEQEILRFLELKQTSKWYLLFSIALIIFIHDAYFYFTHLLMHRSKYLYRFHKVHHASVDPTPLSVFSFHPVESFIHFIFFLIFPLVIPVPLEVVQFMFVWMLICNSAGHLPYEFYPKFLYEAPVLKTFNAATHHYMHHKYVNSNFGLYYNWWDTLMGTNHPEYFNVYRENKKQTHQKLKAKARAEDPQSNAPGSLSQSADLV